MTDVVEIARERQARLAAEIGKLDNFISMAETLVKQDRLESNGALDTEDQGASELIGSTMSGPSSAAAAASGAKSDAQGLARPRAESCAAGA